MALPSGSYALATVSNPSSALTDFTLIVGLANMPASWWAYVDTSDGTKGRASKIDGTELACDWIDFNSTLQTGLLRVIWTGTLASTGTQQVRVYPPMEANASVGASDTYGRYNAYDSYYKGYWPNGGGTDRTASLLDLTSGGGISIGDSAGKIGKATNYDGTDDYAIESTGFVTPNMNLTLLYWLNNDTSYSSDYSVNMYGNSNNYILIRPGYDHILKVNGTTGTVTAVLNHSAGWYLIAGTYDGTTWDVRENASSVGTAAINQTASTTLKTCLGRSYGSAYAYYDGLLQEVQIHSVARSSDWIAEEYAQTNDNATFWGEWVLEVATGIEMGMIMYHFNRMRK
jgi:hypothetical protein